VHAHCQTGVARLRELGVTDERWLDAVRDHHERTDGSGYPAGKGGEAIGQPARLLALADAIARASPAATTARRCSPRRRCAGSSSTRARRWT